MEGAAEQLNAGNATQAAQLAREAMGEINRTAMMVQQALGQLAASESGTGFEEMMAQMAQLAQQQGELNAQTENLFGQPGQSGQPSWQKLAAQQRAIRDALNALRGELARQQRDMLGDLGKIASDMRETASELLQRRAAPKPHATATNPLPSARCPTGHEITRKEQKATGAHRRKSDLSRTGNAPR